MNKERILIVEDNAVNAKLFRLLLVKAGFEVRTAVDANDALAALGDFSPNLILMDVQLPGMDGLELTRRLKADSRYAPVVVVALTAYAMKGDRERALEAGCEGYIAKPIDTRTFAESVRQYIQAGSRTAAAGEKGRLVLIADDEPAQRDLLEIHLTQLGFEVMAARDGAEAIEMMHSRRPDVVASDILMPRLDGFRLAQFIRHKTGWSSVPVVLMTSGAIRPDDEEMARALGANCIVERTDNFENIVRAIQDALVDGPSKAVREDHEVVQELRRRFVEDGCQDARHMLEAFSGSANDDVRKLAHRWVGTSGTLGLSQLSQAAAELETLLSVENPNPDTLRGKLSEMQDLFSAARIEYTAAVSDVVMSSLSGKRFAAVGFDDIEGARLSETLEQANAVLRLRYAPFDPHEDWAQLYDGLILNVGEQPDPSSLSALIAAFDRPLVGIGLPGAKLEAILNAHPHEHDFLLRPWNSSELVLRCFTLLTRSAGHSRLTQKPPASARAVVGASRSLANVLIGDDDPTTVALVRMALESYNMGCEAVSSGGEVLEAVADSRPDLVVLDVNMPQLNAFEVLSALKRNKETRDIPVVLMTAREHETDVLRGFSLGAEDYVTKPFSPIELVARIKRTLGKTA